MSEEPQIKFSASNANRLDRNFSDINERLHGLELTQDRKNSST